MDERQQRWRLLNDDLHSLSNYYREMSVLEGFGVLVVNYYPGGEVSQMSAKYLKSNQIPRLARQMGLPTLQLEFERYNQQEQMVVALVTAENLVGTNTNSSKRGYRYYKASSELNRRILQGLTNWKFNRVKTRSSNC